MLESASYGYLSSDLVTKILSRLCRRSCGKLVALAGDFRVGSVGGTVFVCASGPGSGSVWPSRAAPRRQSRAEWHSSRGTTTNTTSSLQRSPTTRHSPFVISRTFASARDNPPSLKAQSVDPASLHHWFSRRLSCWCSVPLIPLHLCSVIPPRTDHHFFAPPHSTASHSDHARSLCSTHNPNSALCTFTSN